RASLGLSRQTLGPGRSANPRRLRDQGQHLAPRTHLSPSWKRILRRRPDRSLARRALVLLGIRGAGSRLAAVTRELTRISCEGINCSGNWIGAGERASRKHLGVQDGCGEQRVQNRPNTVGFGDERNGAQLGRELDLVAVTDRKSTRLNSSH